MVLIILFCFILVGYLIAHWMISYNYHGLTDIRYIFTNFHDMFSECTFFKVTHGIIFGLILFSLLAITLKVTEDKSSIKKVVHETHQIDELDGKLAITLKSNCDCNCSVEVKYLSTNGIVYHKRFERKNIVFVDGSNKVVIHKQTRPNGFRKMVLGNPPYIETLYLDREYSLQL